MLVPHSPQSILVVSTVISTFTFLATITLLPLFYMKVQRINSQMLTDLRNCHQDSTDIWKQLSQENVRGKRSYGRDAPSIPMGKCCSCQQGKPGPTGPKGPDGGPGQPGLIGLNGRNGRNGKYVASEAHNEPACQKCPVAPPGPPGHPGRKGPRGTAGNAGTAGKNGIPGRMGPPGPAGVRGPPGELGMRGPQGDPGKVLNGAPQGQPGRPGKVGSRGKAGHTGRDGRPGLEGTPGTRGVQGERGSRGARGPPGPPGPAGSDGRKGSCAHCQSDDKLSQGGANRRPEETDPEGEFSNQQPASYEEQPPVITTTTTETAPVYTNPPAHQPVHRSFPSAEPRQSHKNSPSVPVPQEQYNSANSEVIPKTINYPDTINHQSYKHDGDVSVAGTTDDSEDVNVIPAGQYSSRQYASKTNKIGKAVHFGYSNDQLSSFVPMGATSEEDENYGKPRAFQTNKGYNVQIMGSGPTYNAAPVGNAWKQPENHKVRQYTPQYLPPPAYA
ncbi:Nematode cuticle collagen N-terminal domain-containing protein [Caenorhabditis elegans]|uniref:Nematode cuticle collagen N-terminal domain-containing protein n=1 Tax=Caenorhabditis elegans TaxID=6239 RepID=Q21528_CAEEL|nr:Nematode cuticle collagen N-terminal domain-containing protein [Caenorhabditis elegans]CAA90258.2 Nematode cuticle collagen N-terminal domain-containing protein [Caenorhabditis elegans]|eukprot:NP_495726.2 COLlagen [Caenorhabditis elegans]